MKKKLIIGIVVLLVIALAIWGIISLNKKDSDYDKPDYDYVAYVYHSEMAGMDAGTEYIYYIYETNPGSKKQSYFYIKTKASITIAGPSEEEKIGSGSIDKKSDLKEIDKDIEKDTRNDSSKNVVYSDKDGNKYKTIAELAKVLFK